MKIGFFIGAALFVSAVTSACATELETYWAEKTEKGSTKVAGCYAPCPEGYKVTGGGYAQNNPGMYILVQVSKPFKNAGIEGWAIVGLFPEGAKWDVTCHAICTRANKLDHPAQ